MRASGPRAPIGLSIGLHAYEEAAVTRRERSQVAPVVTCVALPVPEVCAFHGVSPRDRWLCVLPGRQMNVNVNVNTGACM